MDIPCTRWYNAIEKRRSRRQFDNTRPIEVSIGASLRAVCDDFRPFPGARACLVTESVQTVFRGIIGNYGKVRDAPAFIALIGNMERTSVQEEVGYTGEGIVLEATSLGLATCWVGLFKKTNADSLVELQTNERVLAVVPVGYAPGSATLEEKLLTGFGHTHKRVPMEKLVSGLSLEKAPEWARMAVQAARLAPSAMNRQPWGFQIGEDSITVYIRTRGPHLTVSKRLDCGIAMIHIEAAAGYNGVKGLWQFLQSPQVARFSISV